MINLWGAACFPLIFPLFLISSSPSLPLPPSFLPYTSSFSNLVKFSTILGQLSSTFDSTLIIFSRLYFPSSPPTSSLPIYIQSYIVLSFSTFFFCLIISSLWIPLTSVFPRRGLQIHLCSLSQKNDATSCSLGVLKLFFLSCHLARTFLLCGIQKLLCDWSEMNLPNSFLWSMKCPSYNKLCSCSRQQIPLLLGSICKPLTATHLFLTSLSPSLLLHFQVSFLILFPHLHLHSPTLLVTSSFEANLSSSSLYCWTPHLHLSLHLWGDKCALTFHFLSALPNWFSPKHLFFSPPLLFHTFLFSFPIQVQVSSLLTWLLICFPCVFIVYVHFNVTGSWTDFAGCYIC